MTELTALAEAVTEFASRAAVKLRKQGSLAALVMVFIHTSPFRKDRSAAAQRQCQCVDQLRIRLRFLKRPWQVCGSSTNRPSTTPRPVSCCWICNRIKSSRGTRLGMMVLANTVHLMSSWMAGTSDLDVAQWKVASAGLQGDRSVWSMKQDNVHLSLHHLPGRHTNSKSLS